MYVYIYVCISTPSYMPYMILIDIVDNKILEIRTLLCKLKNTSMIRISISKWLEQILTFHI